MEQFIPHTPLAIVITVLLTLIVCLKIFKDVKEIRSSRQTHSLIMNFVKKKNTPRISVVIELTKAADTIMPLLDHLYEQNYKGLEVIVMVKHTAGKYAHPKLIYYRRKHQLKDLKIIKHSKGMSMTMLIRRYVSSPFVMQLQSHQSLSKDFFSTIAIDLLDDRTDVIAPRLHFSVGKTVISAVHAAFGVWWHIFATIHLSKFAQNSLTPGRVYRRAALLEREKLSMVYAPRVAVYDSSETSWKVMVRSATTITRTLLHSGRARIVIGLTTIALAGLGAYIWREDTLLFAEFVLAVYSVVYVLSLLGLKGYSLSARINLLLFAPFSLAFSILLGVYALITIFYNWSGLRKLSLRELGARGRRRSLAIPKL